MISVQGELQAAPQQGVDQLQKVGPGPWAVGCQESEIRAPSPDALDSKHTLTGVHSVHITTLFSALT